MEREKKKSKMSPIADEKGYMPEHEAASDTAQERDQLKIELEKANQQAAENFDGWQRERADFLNYKKRIDRDQVATTQNIKGDIIKTYLVVLDDMERALKAKPTQAEGAEWAEGIELIYRKLQNLLANNGVTRIEAEKQEFDPTLHEAITHEDSPEHESGQIIEIIEQGYMLGDRVIRPARVRVAR